MFKNHSWLFFHSGQKGRKVAVAAVPRSTGWVSSCLVMTVLVSCLVGRAIGGLLVQDGLDPGDTYQLVFITSQSVRATSTDIATYNIHVQSAADAAGIGASEGVTWSAIASTPTVHARDNALVGPDTPIFAMNMRLVATGFADLWDGSINQPINLTEFGRTNNTDPWTGTNANGTAATGATLGASSGRAWCGNPASTGIRWVHNQTPPTSQSRPLYALSQELMVPYLPTDYNSDGQVDVSDLNSLVGAIAGGGNDTSFDLTGDGLVDASDLTAWRTAAAEVNGFSDAYLPGDTDLSGKVDSIDLNNLALNWRQDVPRWSGGDFTGDGSVNAADLNELALSWRKFTPLAGTVPIIADSIPYVQDFDEALGPDGTATGTHLPEGWTMTDNGLSGDTTMHSFPIGVTMPSSSNTTSSFNAGEPDHPDRALAVGVTGSEDDLKS